MPRQAKSKPAQLALSPQNELSRNNGNTAPGPENSPATPSDLAGIDLSSLDTNFGVSLIDLPPLPRSPPAPSSPRMDREVSRTLMANVRTRVSPEREQRADPPKARQAKEDDEYRPGSSSVSQIYRLRKAAGSTPELSLVGSAENIQRQAMEGSNRLADTRPQPSPQPSEDSLSMKRREKGFRNPLARARTIRQDSNAKRPNEKQSFDRAPKTAPLDSEWQGSDNMRFLKASSNSKRGKSTEHAIASGSEENLATERPSTKDKDKGGFKSGSKNVMNKAKTGGGSFLKSLGKIGRTSSSHEREVPDNEYVLKVINLPLVEQTRITRISKDLAECKDKTEYWMPSMPWRCIDYLNLNSESEGLYRVPGSGPQVKHWQRRFDTELDVDLLDEQNLYDPNTIGSMLKSWLRELPTEVMPKSLQLDLAAELAADNPDFQRMGQRAPQKLRDALSNLPPFNYYLLFAITCHLSLLLSHTEKNKMDLNNLSICIGPCLELERWLFNYLVGDWRNCWQGCFTEKHYLEAEKAHEQGSGYQMPASTSKQQLTSVNGGNLSTDDGAAQSSGSASSSRQGSQPDASRSVQSGRSSPRTTENTRSDMYKLGAKSNISSGRLMGPSRGHVAMQEVKRPSTSKSSERDFSNGSIDSSRPAMPSHNRSKSDVALTPTKPISPMTYGVYGPQ